MNGVPSMSMPEKGKSLVYLILGAAGSGRREVVADLIAGGSGRAIARRAAVRGGRRREKSTRGLARRSYGGGAPKAASKRAAFGGATHVFWMPNGRRNPVDQIEAVQAWLPASGGELARIVCVIRLRAGGPQPGLLPWYDACVHFADVVLLSRREGVDNKWMSGLPGALQEPVLSLCDGACAGGAGAQSGAHPQPARIENFAGF